MARDINKPMLDRMQPVDTLGRIRIYFDVDRRLSIGITMMASLQHMTRRQYVEKLLKDTINANPTVAEAIGLHEKLSLPVTTQVTTIIGKTYSTPTRVVPKKSTPVKVVKRAVKTA